MNTRFTSTKSSDGGNGMRICLLAIMLLPLWGQSQNYSVDWYKISGGGGTSTGSAYSISGTIGQPGASSAMSGGNYSVTGGFWSLVSVLQTAGAPVLFISHAGGTVTVYWQNIPGWNLVQSGSAATPMGSWSASSGITTNNGTNYLPIAHPIGSLFFRLKQ